MRTAVIDLGTNTFDLIIADTNSTPPVHLYSTKFPVRLGSGGLLKKEITEEAIDRALHTLKDFSNIISQYNCDKIIALATSAVRDATNRFEFVGKIKEETGIEIEIISGDREAELIWLGVKNGIDLGSERTVIMDIGGGSVEFIISDSENLIWKKSFDIGVTRLIEHIQPEDPLGSPGEMAIQLYLNDILDELFDAIARFNVKELIGSSGSFETFADLIVQSYQLPEIKKEQVSFNFEMQHFMELHERLINSTLDERKKMKGMAMMRVDMIVIASALVYYVLKKSRISKMRMTTYSLKEGGLFL